VIKVKKKYNPYPELPGRICRKGS